MSQPEIEVELPSSAGRRALLTFFSGASVGLPLLVFILGVMTGFPIAIFGFDFLVANAALAFAVLFGILFVLTVGGMAIIAFLKPIWRKLFKVGEVELHHMAEPIGEVVRLTSERRIPEATAAAGDLARFVMARYAWIATRRWIVGSVTGFVAVIAVLAGSALLFQQNQLLRHGYFPYADFSQVVLNDTQYGGARLDQARFRGSRLVGGNFASIPNDRVAAPFVSSDAGGYQFTRLIGTRFDGAAIFATSFAGAVLGSATFRNAIPYSVAFDAAELGTTDFDGAVVMEPDFLDRLEVQALGGSFDASKYELVPLSADDLSTHPNLEALFELPADPAWQYFRWQRIAPLETPASSS